MRSRFEWGLITDVQPPDLETRIAILRKKAGSERLPGTAGRARVHREQDLDNIRELEGALIRVTAFANLNRQQVDLSLAEIVLKDLITDDQTTEITATQIIGQTAAYFALSIDDLCGSQPLARPRHRAADRHVPVPRAHGPVPAEDRPGVRWPRPHHRDAREPQDP